MEQICNNCRWSSEIKKELNITDYLNCAAMGSSYIRLYPDNGKAAIIVGKDFGCKLWEDKIKN